MRVHLNASVGERNAFNFWKQLVFEPCFSFESVIVKSDVSIAITNYQKGVLTYIDGHDLVNREKLLVNFLIQSYNFDQSFFIFFAHSFND